MTKTAAVIIAFLFLIEEDYGGDKDRTLSLFLFFKANLVICTICRRGIPVVIVLIDIYTILHGESATRHRIDETNFHQILDTHANT